MLNLKLEVDLKLSQAEKARFTSEKEQADKNAFYSELERAEKAWSANDKPKLNTNERQEPEQTIGGNLHKKSTLSADEKTDNTEKNVDERALKSNAKTEKLDANNNQAEQHIGGNLHNPLPADQQTAQGSVSDEINVSEQQVELEQSIGGNLEKPEFKNSTSDALYLKNDFSSEEKSKILAQPNAQQQIGGNLYVPLGSDEKQSAALENSDVSARNKEQFIGGNLNKDKEYQSNFTSTVGDNTKLAEQPAAKSSSDTLLAQIHASNSQTTEVKQHLAPVSKALKDVLSQYLTSDEQVTTKSGQKIDTILPPNLDKKALEEVIVSPNKLGLEVGKGEKPIDKVWPIIPEEKSVNKLPLDKLGGGVEGEKAQAISKNSQGKQELLNALGIESKAQPGAHSAGKSDSAGKFDSAALEQKVSDSSVKNVLGNELKNVVSAQDIKQVSQSASPLVSTKVSDALQANSEVKVTDAEQCSEDVKKEPVLTSPEAKLAATLERMSKAQESVANSPQKSNAESAVATDLKVELAPEKLEQQINKLAPQDKLALQQSLQQAVDSGKLNDTQLKRAQDVLASLVQSNDQKANDQQNNELQSNQQSSNLGEKSELKAVNLMTGAATVNKADAQVSSYNNTKVTAESLSEVAKATVEQSKTESASKADSADVMQILKEQSDSGSARKIALSVQAENIFKAITAQPQTLSPQSVHDIDISQTVQQFESVMQNAQTQQSSVAAQKLNADPNLAQALNLQKADVVKALHEKVNAMLTINNKEAEIRLDPPELGSMQIRIRSEAEQAQINFVVQNQQAKEALEQSMPKLKEMLAEQGIQLGESNIQQDSGSSSGQGTDDTQESSHSKLANQESQAQNSQQSRSNSVSSESGIDYYA